MARAGPPPLSAGLVFGRLTTTGNFQIRKLPNGDSQRIYECQCLCGQLTWALRSNLRSGNTKSCGCLFNETRSTSHRTHGKTGTRVYRIWAGMIQRCTDPNTSAYKDYGGRGVQVCDRWRQFKNFLTDMGEPPDGYSLERKDVNAGYGPDNCVWATRTEQARNTRRNHLLTLNGETKPLAAWSESLGLSIATIKQRLRKGWPVEKALSLRKFNRSETHGVIQ